MCNIFKNYIMSDDKHTEQKWDEGLEQVAVLGELLQEEWSGETGLPEEETFEQGPLESKETAFVCGAGRGPEAEMCVWSLQEIAKGLL